MKVSPKDIKSAGLTVLYDPDDPSEAVADVVLVHGLGGHPVRSWKWFGRPELPQTPKSARSGTGSFKRLLRRDPTLRRSNSEPLLVLGTKQDSSGRSRNVLRKNSLKSTSRLKLDTSVGDLIKSKDAEVYWPLDLLPRSCPNSRIWTWGYHTLVCDGQPLRLQNDVFAHARELLLDLAEAREATDTSSRPIIFVAHSTGGILVKEVLRLSEVESDGPLKSIILSTSAIIFLGCPHRGSEHARLGDAIRSMASMTLGVDSRDPVLWDLSGAASVELELGRQAFIRMWNDYNFKVKTYQESMVSAVEFLEIRAEAAVRRQSSFIGHPRESAETIAASHLDMCRFGSAEDSGYRSLATALARHIRVEANHRHTTTPREMECLACLTRRQQLPPSEAQQHPAATYPGTCLWLYDLPEFQAWHHRTDRNKNKVLWIKGQSGSGKSVLLRALRGRIEKQWGPAGGSVIWTTAGGRDTTEVFFPGPCGQHAETDPSTVYRSLLAQLFRQDAHLRKALVSLYEKQRAENPLARSLDDASIVSFFIDDYIDSRIETPARRTFILVDVSDTCGPSYLHDLLAHLSQLARNSDFSICIASGSPAISLSSSSTLPAEEDAASYIEVLTQHRNADDVLRYVNITLVAEWEERNRLVVCIGQKAAGVFLWAEIVVNILNAAIGEGASQDMIEYTLEEMPADLHGLYEWMLNTLNEREKAEALVLFQWVILSAEPLRLNDLLVAVRLTKTWSLSPPEGGFRPNMALELDPPSSVRELRKIRNSEVTTDNPHQFNRWIRARSIGLLELRSSDQQQLGGIANESFGLQRVQVTHDSVRTFFLSGRGFACLPPHSSPTLSPSDHLDSAHYSLLHACLTYLNMRDFEPLAASSSSRSHLPPHSHSHSTPLPIFPTTHKQTSSHQRTLITSSYPFLSYATQNLLYHLLSPTHFRYFLPQSQLLAALGKDRCRLWRRWTSLLGCGADPEGVVKLHLERGGAVGRLLSPVFGARFRLERVFRRLRRMSAAADAAAGDARGGSGVGVLSPGMLHLAMFPGLSYGNRRRAGSAGGGGSTKSAEPGRVTKSLPSQKGATTVRPRRGKGKMPLSSYWTAPNERQRLRLSTQEENGTALSALRPPLPPDNDEWPLSAEFESSSSSYYFSPVLSGYSSHYSSDHQAWSGYSSTRRSPLRVDTFRAFEGAGGGGIDGRVGVGMARSA